MKFAEQLVLLIVACITPGFFAAEKCYDELGCFPTDYPWFDLLRPYPGPHEPRSVNTTFYFSNRANPNATYMQTWPTIQLNPGFDGRKPTYFVTHGYFSSSDVAWFKNLTDSILLRSDGNVFGVDWSSGSSTNYFQAASNARMVAAEIQRVLLHILRETRADPSRIHLLGHSLGSHIMAYVAKNVSGIGRITALDPAQPGFQGKNAMVRLDKKDAKFIDVVHTDGRPFLPALGLGMSKSVGTVDFFVNGGKYQPNCVLDGENFIYKKFADIPRITFQVLYNLATCSHSRAPRYMAAAIKEGCMFGKRYNATYASLRYNNFIISDQCNANSCTKMGLVTPQLQAVGDFAMNTQGTYPFCTVD